MANLKYAKAKKDAIKLIAERLDVSIYVAEEYTNEVGELAAELYAINVINFIQPASTKKPYYLRLLGERFWRLFNTKKEGLIIGSSKELHELFKISKS